MSFKGMDDVAMLAFAQHLETSAASLRTSHVQLSHQLRATPWSGPVADRFVGDWSSTHTTTINNAVSLLTDLAHQLRREVDQQNNASAATGAGSAVIGSASPRPGHTLAKPFESQPADPEAIRKAQLLTNGVINGRRYNEHYPGAVAALKEMQSHLSDPPTAAEIEAMRRFQALIRVAELQRSTVEEAAAVAVQSVQDASSSTVSALTSAMGVAKAPEGGFASGVAEDMVRDSALDFAVRGLTNGDPSQIVAAYDRSADKYLTHVGAQAATVAELGAAQDSLAFSNVEVFNGRMEQVRYQDIAADVSHMITGDGSFAQNLGTTVISHLPEVGQVYSGVAAAAHTWHADQEVMTALAAIKVANVDSLSSLAGAAHSYGLD